MITFERSKFVSFLDGTLTGIAFIAFFGRNF